MRQSTNDGANVFSKAVNGVLEIETETASGSGFLIDKYGYALTNAHVVTENGVPNKDIIVRVANEEVSASILELGDDSIDVEDLALIRLSRVPSQATPLALGDFNNVKTGEEIFVIGNSKGEGTCITKGIVSDRNRDGMMMTDASTNNGNSGGPVLNKRGFVIGIQQSHRVDAVGMKYAIPIDIVKQFLIEKCNYNIYKNSASFDGDNSPSDQETKAEISKIDNKKFTEGENRKRASRFCSSCGNALPENVSYCAFCGTNVINQEAESQSQRKTVFDGEIHKCPNCGEVLKAFETFCPACNFELRGARSSSALSELVEKIEELDKKKSEESFKKIAKRKINGSSLSPIEEQKISLISNFPIPNTKEDILEFMILSSSHILSEKPIGDITEHDKLLYAELKKAWKIKFEQAYDKAKICIKNDNLAEIEKCYNKTIVEANKKRNKNTKIAILSMFIPLILIITCFVLIISLTADPSAIKVGVSYEDVKGQYYEDVIEIFENKGFSNIEAREDSWSLFHKSGTVKSVIIDGKEEFYAFSKFPKDAKIIILYYK